jgi:hypothetical protein
MKDDRTIDYRRPVFQTHSNTNDDGMTMRPQHPNLHSFSKATFFRSSVLLSSSARLQQRHALLP